MNRNARILLVVGFLGAALLGSLLGSMLTPDSVAASPLQAFGPAVNLTILPVPNQSAKTANSGGEVKIGDIGTFTVQSGASLVEVTYQGKLAVSFPYTTPEAKFELKVDSAAGQSSSGACSFFRSDTFLFENCTFSGYWKDLTPGQHTISLWAEVPPMTPPYGEVTAVMNYGGRTDTIVTIKEYLPFGSSYLPVMEK